MSSRLDTKLGTTCYYQLSIEEGASSASDQVQRRTAQPNNRNSSMYDFKSRGD